MDETQYRIEIKNWIENKIGLNNTFTFTKYKANKNKKALMVYVKRNFTNVEERKQVYYKYEKLIDEQIFDINKMM